MTGPSSNHSPRDVRTCVQRVQVRLELRDHLGRVPVALLARLAPALQEPRGRRLVESGDVEFVDDERPARAHDLGQPPAGRPERLDVVQRDDRDRRVERGLRLGDVEERNRQARRPPRLGRSRRRRSPRRPGAGPARRSRRPPRGRAPAAAAGSRGRTPRRLGRPSVAVSIIDYARRHGRHHHHHYERPARLRGHPGVRRGLRPHRARPERVLEHRRGVPNGVRRGVEGLHHASLRQPKRGGRAAEGGARGRRARTPCSRCGSTATRSPTS